MNVRTIEVKAVDQPAPGKKQGVVKATDGSRFGVFPDKLGLLRPGHSYEIEFSEREWEGRTYYTISRAKPAPNAMAPIEQERAGRSAPSLDTPTNQEIMFVTRMLCAMVQGGRVAQSEDELAKAAKVLRSAYRRIFGG